MFRDFAMQHSNSTMQVLRDHRSQSMWQIKGGFRHDMTPELDLC